MVVKCKIALECILCCTSFAQAHTVFLDRIVEAIKKNPEMIDVENSSLAEAQAAYQQNARGSAA